MTIRKTIANYGGVHVDATVLTDSESEVDAAKYDRMSEDTAQMTMTSAKAHVRFTTVGSGNPTDGQHRSQWGDGAGQLPVLTRTGVGRYTIDYADSFVDSLGVSESVSFWDAEARARSSNASDNVYAGVLTVSGSVITIQTESPKGTPADVGNVSAAAFIVGVTAIS